LQFTRKREKPAGLTFMLSHQAETPYQIIEGGQKVKIRSQIVDNATCVINGSSMSGETPGYLVKFKKL